MRTTLRHELEKLEAPVLVIIDDIDRLTKREIRLLVQLVKGNANFPNVVYLLLYQKNIVADALDKITSEEGEDFLRKIVQVELEVPAAPDHKLRQMFQDGIYRIWPRGAFPWDHRQNERWRKTFEDAVWPFFCTPRDVKRFLSVYEFYFEAQINDGVLEVNPIDLVLLETLRTFDPEAYEAVSRAFQKQRNIFLEIQFDIKEARDRFVLGIKALIDERGLDESRKRRLKALLNGLFPQASEHAASNSEEWNRDLRICYAGHFPKYFQLAPDPGDVSAALLARIAAVESDREQARTLLQDAIRSGAFVALLGRLRTVHADLPNSSVEAIITALFDISDELPEMKHDLSFDGDVEREIGRLTAFLLTKFPDVPAREAMLLRAVGTTSAVSAPVFCVSLLEPQPEEKQPSDQ